MPEAVEFSRIHEVASTATTMPINFRSWRDTGITWLALAGVDVAKMQRRAGHDALSTTLGYVKVAEDLTGSIGEPFPSLPAALLERSGGGTDQGGDDDWPKSPRHWPKTSLKNFMLPKSLKNSVGEAGFEPSRTGTP
jgi:hypothetical protein